VRISISHTLPRFIQALRRAPRVTLEEADRAVQRAAIEGSRTAKREAPKAFSELVNSIRNEQVGLAFHRIISSARHARYVEEGTGPGGRPPPEVIRRWIQVHQIRPKHARDERELGFLIANKIEREGIDKQPYMEPGRQTSQDRLMALLPAAARRGVEVALS
jgi:hypothetical protein